MLHKFIVCKGFNTQELAARGSIGAFKRVLNHETNTFPKQHTPLAAGLLFFCVLFLCVGFPVFAQEGGASGRVSAGETSNTDANLTVSSASANPDIMLARSSADYRVTPGDVYTLSYAAGSTAVSYIIAVDTSYRIRVSNLGIVNGAGKTFMQLKSEIETIVSNNYPLSGVQLVLTQPAVFTVFVNGEVYRAGEVTAWGLTRLSALTGWNLTGFASTRDISVRSSNGRVNVYDLFKSSRSGDLSHDPYLRPGDVVTFRRIDRRVTIDGAVERPGSYEILKGEKLKDLIGIYGNGYTPLADKSRITLTRYIGSSEISGDITYLTEEDIAGDFDLQHMDIISVPDITLTRPAVHITRMERSITIGGAVRRPGTYSLLSSENLKELIEVYADGFLPIADPSRMEMVRLINSTDIAGDKIFLTLNDLEKNYVLEHYDSITVPDITQLQPVIFVEGAVAVATNTDTEMTEELLSSNRLIVQFAKGETYASIARRNTGWFTAVSDTRNAYIIRNNEHIPINLNLALYDASYRGEVLVEDYDILIIPFRQYFVTVAGAVMNPGRFPYIPDRDWEYYIGLAGGFLKTHNAAESVTVRDMNGKRVQKTAAITPETTITANTNHVLYYFNQFSPVVLTTLSVITTLITVFLLQGR